MGLYEAKNSKIVCKECGRWVWDGNLGSKLTHNDGCSSPVRRVLLQDLLKELALSAEVDPLVDAVQKRLISESDAMNSDF